MQRTWMIAAFAGLVFCAPAMAQMPNDAERAAGFEALIAETKRCLEDAERTHGEAIAALQEKNEATGQEIDRLCEAGRRSEADTLERSLHSKMMKDPAYSALMKCVGKEGENTHACDDM